MILSKIESINSPFVEAKESVKWKTSVAGKLPINRKQLLGVMKMSKWVCPEMLRLFSYHNIEDVHLLELVFDPRSLKETPFFFYGVSKAPC